MILSTQMLLDKFRHYANPNAKIRRMVDNGELFQLTRGVYETDRNTPGYCLAGAIFGPSYLSFDYALAHYGLTPEAVYTYTSATFEKKKIKEYKNIFGSYSYRDVPSESYPFGILMREENGYIYRIACPEKALCDKLYIMPPVTSQKDIERMLFEDLRIEREGFSDLNADDILQIAGKYHCNNLKYFVKYLMKYAISLLTLWKPTAGILAEDSEPS